MEDGSNGLSSETSNLETLKNGEVMAKLPEAVISDNEGKPESPVKVNGNTNADENILEEECDSSDCDALIIDESVKSLKTKKNESRSRCGGFKGFKKTAVGDSFIHSNPYFSESIFDLLEKSQEKKQEHVTEKTTDKKSNCKNNLKTSDKKVKSNPKLREYAQYLGLQPTVQFKCSKCSRAGFQSLQSLNEHLIQCDDSTPVNNVTNNNAPNAPSTNIRVTRKVFLCSACGTYYENWNLFLHMREVHKRYICLYCLGMFSHPDKLSLHIVSKHNCVPAHVNTLEEFYTIHKEPCFLMCCECQKGFTERDNFFDHSCVDSGLHPGKASTNKQAKTAKQKNIEHVTADSVDSETTPIIDGNQNPDIDTVTSNSLLDRSDENSKSENNEKMKMEAEEHINNVANEIKENIDRVDSENNLLTSKLTDTILDDNQKSVEVLNCDNKETDDINLLNEENSWKQTESNSEEEITRQDDSLSQEQANSDDLNDSPDMSTAEEPENETAQESNIQDRDTESDVEMETRKVPKVTLKLPKSFDFMTTENEDFQYESDDSENLTMEVDQIENESESVPAEDTEVSTGCIITENQFQVAGPDVPILELELEQPLDKFDIRVLLQKCLRTTISTCIYCNHARRISVNGKQLGLHAIAEHRFSAVVNSITAEELIPESFVARIKDGLTELENVYFNLETNLPDEAITFSHIFECFQCRYSTNIHKELYLHNRKMHAKSILLCIMCKSNFYSYSELICHLCPGVYELEKDVQFRCCMCVSDDLPSAFRLMVHLRKRHHACDVCLELCHNQSKLSNHVWKHKLHHLCYRCGIAYRNKPDITKHLYWKHGTESVTCKKCLQKKWPHVYHFCIPPLSFICEDCNLSFSRAVSLMVHKRFHTDHKPHACTEEDCQEKFVSKKLLLKHEFKHREPPEEPVKIEPEKAQEIENTQPPSGDSQNLPDEKTIQPENEEKIDKPKPKVDVYDLPELNLSESDSSDSDDDKNPKNTNDTESNEKSDCLGGDKLKENDSAVLEKPPPVMETIWDDFRNYQANKEKEELKSKQDDYSPLLEIIMNDHDYCVAVKTEDKEEPEPIKVEETDGAQMSVDHDYCFGQKDDSKDVKEKSPKKKASSSSGSSSDSDSSSCTCGSNCSCSSTSGSSSSSSDSSESDSSSSEGRRRQQARRERRKQKLKSKKKENETVDVVATDNQPVIPLDVPVQESDLETTESDTDEDFYDEQPQKLANKLLTEKKNQLLQMAAIGPYINGSIMDGSRPPTPSLPEETKPRKKSKNKKRKKKNRSSKYQFENPTVDIPQTYQPMAPLTLTLPKNSPVATPQFHSPNSNPMPTTPSIGTHLLNAADHDSTLRASKRRRVPNKFYGYSSDEEREKIPQPPVLKWRKVDLPSPRSPLIVPPLTIKTMPPPPPALDPILSRGTTTSGESRIHHARIHTQMRPPVVPKLRPPMPDQESATDSNDSSSEEDQPTSAPPIKEQPALYCYCRCPYDEVSEMIGCDATDCAIEWFHFECVGIMVPPKGQWFCPDCRKKKQQRREALQNQL